MRLSRETYQIQQTIETHLPHLSQPQLAGLALWVCGAILAGSACQNAVASALSPWLSWNNLRQHLREWLYDRSDRARPCKTQLDVTLCFAPLLRWVLTWCLPGGVPADWPWPWIPVSRATRPPPSSSASSTGAAPLPWPGASAAPLRPAPGWIPPWNCSKNWPRRFLREMTGIVLCDRGISRGKLWKQIRAQRQLPARLGGWHPWIRYREEHHLQSPGRSPAARPALRLPSRHGLDRTWHRLRHSLRPTPLHPAGGLVRPAGGTLDHPHRPASPGSGTQLERPPILDRAGLQSLPPATTGGHQEPGLEVGQDQAHQPGARLPPLAGAVGGDAPGPGLRRQSLPPATTGGWKTPMTAGLPQATCGRRPMPAPYWIRGRCRPGIATVGRSRNGRSASSATASTDCGGCCSRAVSGAGSGCCPNPGPNPSPTWKSPATPPPENPLHTPVSPPPPAGQEGRKSDQGCQEKGDLHSRFPFLFRLRIPIPCNISGPFAVPCQLSAVFLTLSSRRSHSSFPFQLLVLPA